MNKKHKEMLMASVTSDTLKKVHSKFKQHNRIIQDEDFFDYQLLKAALNRGHKGITIFLLELGCRVRNPNKINSEETPLHLAVKLSNDIIIKKILLSGASIYDKNENGETPIQAGFKQGYQNSVNIISRSLYSKDDKHLITLPTGAFKDPDPKNEDDILHFHIACIMNNLDVVRRYLEFGFDMNSPLSLDSAELSGLNPLHYAATKKYYNSSYKGLLYCFVEQGADLSIKNSDGLTALHIFYYSSNFRMIDIIFNHKNETKFINSIDCNGVSHFHLCCMTSNPKNVQVFIDKGVDINSAISWSCSNYPGFTPLHFAVMSGYGESVQLLLANGADCNKANKEGSTPLHLACELNFDTSIIEMLLNYNACASAVDGNKSTPLHTAFYNSPDHLYFYKSKIFHMLISKIPRQVNITDSQGLSYFHIICTGNNRSLVEDYLKSGVAVNSCVKSGRFRDYTALHFAILYNQIEIVELLLNWNTQVNFNTDQAGTPLHFAVKYGSDKVVQLLLQNGAECNKMDKEGNTPLHLANNSKVKLIFNHGNDTKFINSVNSDGLSHFHLCCTQNYPDLVKVFIDKGVDVNSAIPFSCSVHPGFTPLHFAIKYECDKVVQLLLKHGADCNKKAKGGTTPLHLVCDPFFTNAEVRLPIIEMLLNYEASVIVNEKGQTPLHLAFDNMDDEETKAFDMLISKIPLNVNFTDSDGLSHFHIVCTKNVISRVEDFLKSGVAVDSSVVSGCFAGYTALHFAAIYNQMHVVEMLLNWKAQVNIKTHLIGVTPLHLACEFSFRKLSKMYNHYKYAKLNNESINIDWTLNRANQLNIIKLLLLHGADVESKDCENATVLLNTCQIGIDFPMTFYSFIKDSLEGEILFRIKEIIEILLLNKAHINAQMLHNNESLLHIIAGNYFLKNSEEFIAFILSKGADINAADSLGYTPLHYAVTSKNKKLVHMLLKNKANVSAKTTCSGSFTPLEIVCKDIDMNSSRNRDILCSLLEASEGIHNVRDYKGRLLLQDAIENCKTFVIKKLLYYGADINMEDSQGNLSVSDLFSWIRETTNEFEWTNYICYVEVFQIVFLHVQKLLAAGHYVHEKIQQCCIQLNQRYSFMRKTSDDYRNLDNIYDNCIEELVKMKLLKVDNYTSLRCILVKNAHELSKHVKNETLVKILENPNIDDNYPLYSYLLKIQFKKGLIRSDALQTANTALCSAIGLNLPDLCCDSILQYLTNEEIAALKIVVSAITSCKRKLSNDCTKMEPSAKLQKKECNSINTSYFLNDQTKA